MKKRIVTIVAICMIAVMICAFAVACDNKGLSAYELAVQNGFTGTLDEWLESLKGKDGIDGIDGADGQDGEKGADGANGTDGRNGLDGQDVSVDELYQKAQANGFQGTFLEFLKEYLSLNVDDETAFSNRALLSSVIVSCSFTYMDGGYYLQPIKEVQATSNGSGVIYSLDKETGTAYIITNHHVVYSSIATEHTSTNGIIDDISIFLYGADYLDYKLDAEYVGGSQTYDIAVLKVEESQIIKESDVMQVEIANSDEVVVGSGALVVGNAAGMGISVTKGIVSVDSESITVSDGNSSNAQVFTHRVMRVDAAVNSGNSGGGLFNLQGQLIGIVNAKTSSSSIENMGYAIPSNVALAVARNIIDNCDNEEAESKTVSKIVLGIQLAVNSSRAVYDGNTMTTKIVEDIVIKAVEEESLAEGKLQADDIVKSVAINSEIKQITRSFHLSDFLINARAGDTIVLTVVRVVDDEPIELQVEIVAGEEAFSQIN
ncbi:MAG: S1C family serine protease [Clostridia bacterium]|nr:S1C family serine protease [Clostridia bacterium]